VDDVSVRRYRKEGGQRVQGSGFRKNHWTDLGTSRIVKISQLNPESRTLNPLRAHDEQRNLEFVGGEAAVVAAFDLPVTESAGG
jgi:hypothetical protein